MEWKFARTKLFMEYIREGSTLATPFNLVPTWKGVLTLYHNFADNWCYRLAGRAAPDTPEESNSERGSQGSDISLVSKRVRGKYFLMFFSLYKDNTLDVGKTIGKMHDPGCYDICICICKHVNGNRKASILCVNVLKYIVLICVRCELNKK